MIKNFYIFQFSDFEETNIKLLWMFPFVSEDTQRSQYHSAPENIDFLKITNQIITLKDQWSAWKQSRCKMLKSSLLAEEITEPTKSAEERIRVIC